MKLEMDIRENISAGNGRKLLPPSSPKHGSYVLNETI